MRLIDADDFDTKLFNDGFFGGLASAIGNTPRKRKFTIGEFRGMLKNAPTVDAVPVRHGYQVYHNRPANYEHYEMVQQTENGDPLYKRQYYTLQDNPVAYCSECGKRLCSRFTNFCPNCGAKMDLKE